MTNMATYALKRYAALAGIVLVLLTLVFGLSYIRRKNEDKYLTAAAVSLLSRHPGFADQSVSISGRADGVVPTSLPFRAVLRASYAGRDALIFFLPITGKYGVYPAVFFYEQTLGCVFCGLAGIDAAPEMLHSYGITSAAIKIQQAKIETLMQKYSRQP